MKKLGIITSVLVGVAMLAVSGGSVMAASNVETAPYLAVAQVEQLYQGIVGTVGADSDIAGGILKVTTKSLGEVEVVLNEATIYSAPGQAEVAKEDIAVGGRVAILATLGEDGKYVALRVMAVPKTPTRQHVSGVVVSVENKVMTVMNAAGETITIELPDGVKGGVVGDFISTSVRKAASGEKPVATGTQTAAEVQTRLQTQLNAVAGQQVATQAEVQTREQTMTKLGEKLEGLVLQNKGVLEKVMAKAPESAKAGIQAAIGNCEQRMEQARQAIQNAQQKAGGTQQSTQSGQATNTPGSTTTPGGQGGKP
ncbi:MAG: hypothetical protein JW856_02335 [Dehalococcoidales bacterium]|nr:hypothetical protein [Dehalococcoidales bacterium]